MAEARTTGSKRKFLEATSLPPQTPEIILISSGNKKMMAPAMVVAQLR
jgi:hypothetical protein